MIHLGFLEVIPFFGFFILPGSPYDSPLLNSLNQSASSSLLLPRWLSPQCKVRKITVQCVAAFSSRLSWLHWERGCVCVLSSEPHCCDCYCLVTTFFPYLAFLKCLSTELPSLSQASVYQKLHKEEHIFLFLILDSVVWTMELRQYWHWWF